MFSNRNMKNRFFSFEGDRKLVTMKVTGTGNGTVPTLDAANSKGIASITRVGAGLYDIQLGASINGLVQADPYVKLLGIGLTLGTASFAAATSVLGVYFVPASTFVSTTGVIRIQMLSGTDAAVDPANGDVVLVEFTFGDSTAG